MVKFKMTVIVVLEVFLKNVLSVSQYNLMKLQSDEFTFDFPVSDESQCLDQCANFSTLSYSAYLHKCVASKCSNVNLSINALWTTIFCDDFVQPNCNLPEPMFDWIVDGCGYLNTGWYNPGLPLQPTIYGSTVTWSPVYNISVGTHGGKAIWFPNIMNYLLMTPYFELRLKMSSSVTLFTYFRVYSTPSSFALIELGTGDSLGATYNFFTHFWYYNGGLYFNFDYSECTGHCRGNFYSFVPVLNAWYHVALVYNAAELKFQAYLNGTIVWTSNSTRFSTSSATVNYITSGGRPNAGQLPGSVYCLKIYQAALRFSDIQNVAASCGQARVSNQNDIQQEWTFPD